MIEVLDKEQFQEKVINSDGNLLVEFFATWCPHCKAEAPVVDKLAVEEEGIVPVYRVDIDQSPEVAQAYAPDGVPTFVLFDKGQMIDRKVGEQPKMELERMVA